MSDPRLNDPRFDTRLSEPVVRRDVSNTWAWIGGIAAVLLIAFVVLGNWHTGTDTGTPVTASTTTAPLASPGAPVRNVTPPTTTGSGATSPEPATPAPAPSNPNPQ